MSVEVDDFDGPSLGIPPPITSDVLNNCNLSDVIERLLLGEIVQYKTGKIIIQLIIGNM